MRMCGEAGSPPEAAAKALRSTLSGREWDEVWGGMGAFGCSPGGVLGGAMGPADIQEMSSKQDCLSNDNC